MVVFVTRMELQEQGTASPHIHCLLWTNEPPIVMDEPATIPRDVMVLLEPILGDVTVLHTMEYAQLDPVDSELISPSQLAGG